MRLWDKLLGPGFASWFAESVNDPWCYFEWRIGNRNVLIPDDVVAAVWNEFHKKLIAYHR